MAGGLAPRWTWCVNSSVIVATLQERSTLRWTGQFRTAIRWPAPLPTVVWWEDFVRATTSLSTTMASRLLAFILTGGLSLQALAQAPSGPSSYVAPAEFPSSIFPSYYYGASPTQNPQPAIQDPVLDVTYPLNLTDPKNIPTNDTDPPILPPAPANVTSAQASAYLQTAYSRVQQIASGNGTNCTKCVDSLRVLQNLSQLAPSEVPDALVRTCEVNKWHSNSTCEEDFGLYTVGSVWTQVIRYGDVGGLDGRYMCYYASTTTCPRPVVDPPLDTSKLFPKPKPKDACAPEASGQRVKVRYALDAT